MTLKFLKENGNLILSYSQKRYFDSRENCIREFVPHRPTVAYLYEYKGTFYVYSYILSATFKHFNSYAHAFSSFSNFVFITCA